MPIVPEAEFEEFLVNLRRFVRETLIPNEPRLEAEDAVPPEILEEMRRLGLFATSLPPEYGGLGLTMEQQVRAHMEFTQASAVYRSRLSTTIGLGDARKSDQPFVVPGDCARSRISRRADSMTSAKIAWARALGCRSRAWMRNCACSRPRNAVRVSV